MRSRPVKGLVARECSRSGAVAATVIGLHLVWGAITAGGKRIGYDEALRTVYPNSIHKYA